MATMDLFEGDAFSIIELTRALENIPFKPAILSGAGLFGSQQCRFKIVALALCLENGRDAGNGTDRQPDWNRHLLGRRRSPRTQQCRHKLF